MNTGRLYISFWHICLDNLPEGRFQRRRILPEEARRHIEQARQENRLLCLSAVDLAAPFKKREAENHEALCRVLSGHFGIALSPKDFFSRHDDEEGEALYFANALSLVQVAADCRLLVVTCSYAFAEENTSGKPRRLEIVPDTVQFHLIEAA